MTSTDPTSRPPTLAKSATYLADWVAKRARADIQQALGDMGLTTPEFGVLAALADWGELSQQQLADGLGADKGHAVRLIDQLEKRGLLVRAPHRSDRRRHRLQLTDSGAEALNSATPVVHRVEDTHFGTLTPSERRTLIQLLQRVLQAQDNSK